MRASLCTDDLVFLSWNQDQCVEFRAPSMYNPLHLSLAPWLPFYCKSPSFFTKATKRQLLTTAESSYSPPPSCCRMQWRAGNWRLLLMVSNDRKTILAVTEKKKKLPKTFLLSARGAREHIPNVQLLTGSSKLCLSRGTDKARQGLLGSQVRRRQTQLQGGHAVTHPQRCHLLCV